MVLSSCSLILLAFVIGISLVLQMFIHNPIFLIIYLQFIFCHTLNSVASFSFSSIETFECESLTFSWEDEGSAVAICKDISATITRYYKISTDTISE